MARRKGHFSAGHFIGCWVCRLHVLVGNRTVVPQKHRISQNCTGYNILNGMRNTYPKAYIMVLNPFQYQYNGTYTPLHNLTLSPDPAKHTLELIQNIKVPYMYMDIIHATG